MTLRWMNALEKLPEENELVIAIYYDALSNGGLSSVSCSYVDNKWLVDHFCESSYVEDVILWMPFPVVIG